MRNLKKLLAVILTVVMIASMMVPALAANTYEAEALKLQAINVFAGGPEDLKLDEGVTRIQGLTFAIRAAGKDAEALAMEDAEVDAILADWTDADSIPAWGRKYAAYAIKNSITVGLSSTEKIFGALNPISGTSFLVFIMKAGMGYADVTTANVIEAAVNAGILTAGQAATFGAKEALIRDDAAGILYGAFTTGVNADGTKLIDAYIASGATTLEDAIEAGFAEEVVPEELEVVSVEALNLIQVEVVFNKEVDSDTAEDENNYDVEGKTVNFAELQDDNKTVILTLNTPADQQDELDVEIEDVEDLDENALKDVTFEDVYFIDTTMPVVELVEIVGIDTLKVTFSEPVISDATGGSLRACFEVKDANGNKIYVKADNATTGTRYVSDAKTAVYVVLSSDLDDEESITVKVNSDMEDYAGFSVMPNLTELDVEVDDEPPVVVGYKDAKLGSVTLIFNEDIKVLGGAVVGDFYHTNSKSPVKAVPSVTKGNELKLEFDEDSQLPEGTAYVYIDKEVISDYWENENEQIMVKIEVEVDETKPVLEKIEVDEENQITLTFSEDVTDVTRSDFKVYDEDDDAVSIKTVSVSGDEVVIIFRENLSGDYTITIEGIEDLAGNKISKTTETFNVDDKTAPDLADSVDPDDKVTVTLYNAGSTDQMIKINYKEKMATTGKYSVLSADNYIVVGKDLTDLDEVSIESVDDGKGVEIYIPYDPTDKDIKDNPLLAPGQILTIARVADAAGNYTKALSTDKIIDDGSTADIKFVKAEIIDAKTIEVTLDDKVADFYEEDFILNGSNPALTTANIAKISLKVNDKGNTVIVITLDDEIASGGFTITISTPADTGADVKDTKTENQYGVRMKEGDTVTVDDKVAPAIAKDDDDDLVYAIDDNADGYIDYVVLEYQEAIDDDFLNKYTYAIDDVTIDSVYTAAALASFKTAVVDPVDGKFVVIKFAARTATVNNKIPLDTAWLPEVEQNASIYDLDGNELKAGEVYSSLDEAAPAIVAVELINAAGVADDWDGIGDKLVLTFSEDVTLTVTDTIAPITLTEDEVKALTGVTTVAYDTDTEVTATIANDTITLTISGQALTAGIQEGANVFGTANAIIKDKADNIMQVGTATL